LLEIENEGVYRTCNTDCNVKKKESRDKEEKNEEANYGTQRRRRRGMLRHGHRASIVQTRRNRGSVALMGRGEMWYG
jgi:hypothetical protein